MLGEQLAYYRARAPEYDDWFFRRGRYDRGVEANALWFREVDEVRAALARELPAGDGPANDVLELACGTGLWTERLAGAARRVTAVDASSEVIALNRARIEAARRAGEARCAVDFELADVFTWQPARRYDLVFFGFWISHVPPARFEAFWRGVERALAPEGRVFFVDNRASSSRAAPRTGTDTGAERAGAERADAEKAEGIETRTLRDGREFAIVKVFYEPAALEQRLAGLGFAIDVRETERHFLYGAGGRA